VACRCQNPDIPQPAMPPTRHLSSWPPWCGLRSPWIEALGAKIRLQCKVRQPNSAPTSLMAGPTRGTQSELSPALITSIQCGGGVRLAADGQVLPADSGCAAVGHSARDNFSPCCHPPQGVGHRTKGVFDRALPDRHPNRWSTRLGLGPFARPIPRLRAAEYSCHHCRPNGTHRLQLLHVPQGCLGGGRRLRSRPCGDPNRL